MITFINDIENITAKYGLKLSSLDVTDCTLMARIDIIPPVFIQVYLNMNKKKRNMTLVFGNHRIYGVDSEGGIPHEHPAEDPQSHISMDSPPTLEAFIIKCLGLLQQKDIL
ncbi:MAG: hypothetical protein WA081_14425 [Desulfosalsimonadaceae bacterium]